jgi:hypothetical protein
MAKNLINAEAMKRLRGGTLCDQADLFESMARDAAAFNAAVHEGTIRFTEEGDEREGEYIPEITFRVRRVCKATGGNDAG